MISKLNSKKHNLTKREREAVAEALSEVTIRFRKYQLKKEFDLPYPIKNISSNGHYMALANALEDTKEILGVQGNAEWHRINDKKNYIG